MPAMSVMIRHFRQRLLWPLQLLRPEQDEEPDDGAGPLLRVHQIEYHRMPVMSWLALDDPIRPR